MQIGSMPLGIEMHFKNKRNMCYVFYPVCFLCSAVMPVGCSYFLDLCELTFHFSFSHENVYCESPGGAQVLLLDFGRGGMQLPQM